MIGDRLARWLAPRLLAIPRRREPDFIIGGAARPYLLRWWLIPRNPLFNVYLHRFCRSDDDRALHDHPWFNASLILAGQYFEHQINAGGVNVRRHRERGAIAVRSPWTAHRVELRPGFECWSLFITGPKLRAWGFHCPQGWVHWRDFTATEDPGAIGRGCA